MCVVVLDEIIGFRLGVPDIGGGLIDLLLDVLCHHCALHDGGNAEIDVGGVIGLPEECVLLRIGIAKIRLPAGDHVGLIRRDEGFYGVIAGRREHELRADDPVLVIFSFQVRVQRAAVLMEREKSIEESVEQGHVGRCHDGRDDRIGLYGGNQILLAAVIIDKNRAVLAGDIVIIIWLASLMEGPQYRTLVGLQGDIAPVRYGYTTF